MNTTDDTILKKLLPLPRELKLLSTNYHLDESCAIICRTPTGSIAGERLANMIEEEWGLSVTVRNESAKNEYILQILGNQKSQRPSCASSTQVNGLGDEEYLLRVDAHGATVEARTARALLWGAMTIRQLILSDGKTLSIRGVEIQDRPRYSLRGFMIDSGRAPNSLPKMKRIIRICSAFKLNALFFREGDDELNAVRYNTNKLGSLNPFSLSLEELAELSAYAGTYGITLIPEVESLGHSAAKGIHFPDLVSGGFEAEYDGIGSHVRKAHLAPCDPRTFELLESIYNEMFATLRDPFIHLGLDEVRLPASEKSRHMKELLPIVFRCAERYGIQASPIVWSDAPATPDEYGDRVHRCLWGYADGGDISIEDGETRQGLDVLSQPRCPQPVLMAGGSASGHTPYSKSTYEGAYRNLAAWAQWGESRKNYVGLLAVQWSGNMTDEWLPDFLAAAGFGWTPPKSIESHESLDRRIREHLSRLTDSSSPRPEEVDRPAWDGIWLKGNHWDEEILPIQCRRLQMARLIDNQSG